MAVPDYQTIMLPLLRLAADQQEHSFSQAIQTLAAQFHLNEAERKELLPSGRQPAFDNRVGWARTYMVKAGLLKAPKRGYFQITQRGLDVLKQNPTEISVAFLKQFPEFVEFQAPKTKEPSKSTVLTEDETKTPEEILESAYQRLRQGLAQDLLQAVKDCSPGFFEQLVVDLLVGMGYGGTRKDAGQAIGKSGDGGIDGIIKEDRLGLDIVYIQAKRWDDTVSRPEIQKFAGALLGQKAIKGIFITTSGFSQAARDYASSIESNIVLIDGTTLTQLIIDFNIGVNTLTSYELKRIDSDYFTED
jgi:restriction system protein